jgi:hypothetical protein
LRSTGCGSLRILNAAGKSGWTNHEILRLGSQLSMDADELHQLHSAVDVAHALADFEACRRGYASSLEWVAATGVMRLMPGTEVVVEGDMRPGEWRIEQNSKTIRSGRLKPLP